MTVCDSCTVSGPNMYSSDGEECRDCPPRKAPNYERTECFCQADTYSAADAKVTCGGTSSRSDGMVTDECAVCPDCMDCTVVGKTMLKRGWAFFGRSGDAYRCPGAGTCEACPPLLLDNNATMDRSTCAVGYDGPVCGNCQLQYHHLKVGDLCNPCDDNVTNVPMMIGILPGGVIIGGAVITGAIGVLKDWGMITDIRLLVGFYQILGQASNVLDVVLPYPVPGCTSLSCCSWTSVAL